MGLSEFAFSDENVVSVVSGHYEDADAGTGQRFGDARQDARFVEVELTIDPKACPTAFGLDLVRDHDVWNNDRDFLGSPDDRIEQRGTQSPVWDLAVGGKPCDGEASTDL